MTTMSYYAHHGIDGEVLEPLGFAPFSSTDVPDDLMACTPINGWDSPAYEQQFTFSTTPDLSNVSAKLETPIIPTPMSVMWNNHAWTPPQSPPPAEEDCENLIGCFDLPTDFNIGTEDKVKFQTEASMDSESESSTSFSEADSDSESDRRPVRHLGRVMKKRSAERKGHRAGVDAKLRAVAEAATPRYASSAVDLTASAAIAAAAAEVNRLRESEEIEDPEARRLTHNVLERKRRNDLKTSYQVLRANIPDLEDNDRTPTGQILLHAVEYIEALEMTEARLVQAISQARALNEQLKAARYVE